MRLRREIASHWLKDTGRIGLLPHFLPRFSPGLRGRKGSPPLGPTGGDLSPALRGENGGKRSPLVIVIGGDSFPPYGQRGRILPLLKKRRRRSFPWIMQRGESSPQLYHRVDSLFNRKSSRGASRAGQTGAPRGITLGGVLLRTPKNRPTRHSVEGTPGTRASVGSRTEPGPDWTGQNLRAAWLAAI
jgi:hypothetical protein